MSEYSGMDWNMRIVINPQDCTLSDEQKAEFYKALDTLDRLVAHFPEPELYITIIRHARTHDFHVKAHIVLAKGLLFTGDRDEDMYAAYSRCIRKLIHKVKSYEEKLARTPERAKQIEGTRQEVLPDREPDGAVVEQALAERDYPKFRAALYGYDEPLRKRAGRWIERFPDLESHVGDDLKLEDVVEEVMLNAFERYDRKPKELRFGEWLESLIDPSIRALWRHPGEEKESVSFARTWQEAGTETEEGPGH